MFSLFSIYTHFFYHIRAKKKRTRGGERTRWLKSMLSIFFFLISNSIFQNFYLIAGSHILLLWDWNHGSWVLIPYVHGWFCIAIESSSSFMYTLRILLSDLRWPCSPSPVLLLDSTFGVELEPCSLIFLVVSINCSWV